MNNFAVIRLHTSGYCQDDFEKTEQNQIEKLGLTYHHLKKINVNDFKDREIILISTSNVDPSEIPSLLLANTRLLIHPNSGYDNLNPWFKDQPFPIVIGNEIRAQAVAEYAISCLFHHYSPIQSDLSWDRHWNRNLLSEINIAIIGYGHIGEIVQKCLNGLGLNTHIYDPFKGHHNLDWEAQDAIILVPSLSDSNKHFLNAHIFNKLKDETVIINPARGGLIDEQALIDFLNQKPKAFAYLDVFENEPTDFKQFSKLQNIKHTSHRAGVYNSLDQKIINFSTEVIESFVITNDFTEKYEKMILGNQEHH